MSNRQAGGVGIVLRCLEGDEIEYMMRFDFLKTNNEVEYEALVAGSDLAQAVGASSMVVYYDS